MAEKKIETVAELIIRVESLEAKVVELEARLAKVEKK